MIGHWKNYFQIPLLFFGHCVNEHRFFIIYIAEHDISKSGLEMWIYLPRESKGHAICHLKACHVYFKNLDVVKHSEWTIFCYRALYCHTLFVNLCTKVFMTEYRKRFHVSLIMDLHQWSGSTMLYISMASHGCDFNTKLRKLAM